FRGDGPVSNVTVLLNPTGPAVYGELRRPTHGVPVSIRPGFGLAAHPSGSGRSQEIADQSGAPGPCCGSPRPGLRQSHRTTGAALHMRPVRDLPPCTMITRTGWRLH